MALIELRNLCKTFKGKTQTVDALKDISLDINKGDIYGIIGMSGAGKSTLVRCINYLEIPTSGAVFFREQNLGTLSDRDLRKARSKMGMIFQQFNLLSQRNVLKSVNSVGQNLMPGMRQRLNVTRPRLTKSAVRRLTSLCSDSKKERSRSRSNLTAM